MRWRGYRDWLLAGGAALCTPYGAHALNNDPTVTGFNGNIGWFDNGAKYALHKDIRNDSASLKIDWQVSAHATLTSVTGFDYGRWYEKSDDGGLPITVRLDDPNTYFSSVNAFSQEIRLVSHDTGAFGWLAGLYYGRESTHPTVQFHFFDGNFPGAFVPQSPPTDPNVPVPLWGFDEYNSFDQLKDSRAVFLNTTFLVGHPACRPALHQGQGDDQRLLCSRGRACESGAGRFHPRRWHHLVDSDHRRAASGRHRAPNLLPDGTRAAGTRRLSRARRS